MNNEETILDPQAFAGSNSRNQNATSSDKTESNTPSKKETKPAKGNNTAEKAAYAAGGFVAGAASMAAGDVFATTKTEEAEKAPEEQPQIDPANSPSEHEAIVASDEGLRVAQVDDDEPFIEAFADARAQVGPGGVFEWHGKVYGTFYKDEWDQMSAEERAEWQSKVDYNDLRDENEAQQYAQHQDTQAQEPVQNANVHQTSQSQEQEPAVEIADIRKVDVDGNGQLDTVVELNNGVMFADLDHNGVADVAAADVNGDGMISNDEVADVRAENIVMPQAPDGTTSVSQQSGGNDDVDVHVIEVGQADLDGNGMAENVALVEIDGNEVMIVDIDHDNIADVMITDTSGNGQIESNEIIDISGEGVGMPTMSDGDLFMAQNEMEPDYTNDADMGLFEA